MLVQKTKYSHIAIQIEEEVLDATIHGVNFTAVRDYRLKYQIVKKVKIKTEDVDLPRAYAWAWKYRRVEYSILQNIGLGLKHLKLIKSNPFGGDDRQIVCSELAILFMHSFSNLQIGDSDNYDLVLTEEITEGLKC